MAVLKTEYAGNVKDLNTPPDAFWRGVEFFYSLESFTFRKFCNIDAEQRIFLSPNDTVCILSLALKDQIIGCGVAGFRPDDKNSRVCWISMIAVEKSFRGKRFGAMLLKALENWLVENAPQVDMRKNIYLQPVATSTQFYERHGYNVITIDKMALPWKGTHLDQESVLVPDINEITDWGFNVQNAITLQMACLPSLPDIEYQNHMKNVFEIESIAYSIGQCTQNYSLDEYVTICAKLCQAVLFVWTEHLPIEDSHKNDIVQCFHDAFTNGFQPTKEKLQVAEKALQTIIGHPEETNTADS